MTEQARDPAENLGLDEVPLCFGPLARFGGLVIGADSVPQKLAKVGCVANCNDCRVADFIAGGTEVLIDVTDIAAARVAKTIRMLESVGRDAIEALGFDLNQDS